MRSLFGAVSVVLLGASLFGCTETDTSDLLDASEAPPLEGQTGPGPSSGGSNGLKYQVVQEWQPYLIKAAFRPLLEAGTNHTAVDSEAFVLAQSDAGRSLFHYAVACGVPAGMVISSNGYDFEGKGHMMLSKKWIDEGLTVPEANELLGCVAAHMNKRKGVPIVLSGPNVIDDGIDHSEFWVEEARWGAKIVSPSHAIFLAWLMPNFQPPACTLYPSPAEALEERFCGTNPQQCDLVVGDPQDCKPAKEGGWTCEGNPVVETRLTEEDLPEMYCD